MKNANLPPGARELTMEEAKREGVPGSIVVDGNKCYVTAQCPNGKEVKCNGDIYTCTIHMVGSGVVGVKCNDKFESCSGSTSGTGFGSMSDKSHMPINGNKL